MQKAKLFRNGQSQAVRFPKTMRFEGEQVYLKQVGNAIVILPFRNPWQAMIESLSMFSPDFMADSTQQPLQERESFD